MDSSYPANEEKNGSGFDGQKQITIWLSLEMRNTLVQPAESVRWQREQLRGRCLGGGTKFSRNRAQ